MHQKNSELYNYDTLVAANPLHEKHNLIQVVRWQLLGCEEMPSSPPYEPTTNLSFAVGPSEFVTNDNMKNLKILFFRTVCNATTSAAPQPINTLPPRCLAAARAYSTCIITNLTFSKNECCSRQLASAPRRTRGSRRCNACVCGKNLFIN